MFDLLIRALLYYRAIHLRRPCIAAPLYVMFMLHHSFTSRSCSCSFHVKFMLLFNPCLLSMQFCIFIMRASAPPPIAAPVITIQAMSKVHSPPYVICPTLQFHVCPLQSPDNVCIVCVLCQAAPSVYMLPLGRGLLCPCLPRSTMVELRGLGAGRQSRLHLRVVHILVVLFGSSRNTVAWLNGHAPRLNTVDFLNF
jgi:hypothetical protein